MTGNDVTTLDSIVLNQHPTIQFLKALGKPSAYIRSCLGKAYPDVPNLYKGSPGRMVNVRCNRSGNTLEHLEWKEADWERLILELTRQNAADTKVTKTFPYQLGGWVPYAVINDGGHKKEDIFSCPAAYNEFDLPVTKEESMAKLLAFSLPPSIINDSRNGIHCVPLNTEILTKVGWKTWDQVHPGDVVMGYDVQRRSLRWTTMDGKVVKESDDLIKIGNSDFSAICTPQHRWAVRKLVRHENKRVRGQKERYMSAPQLEEAQNIAKNTHQLVLSAPLHLPGTCDLTEDECAILGWFAAEGSLSPSGDFVSKSPRGYGAKFQEKLSQSLKKANGEYVDKIRFLLRGVPHTESSQHSSNPEIFTWTFQTQWFRDLWYRADLDRGWVCFVNTLGSLQRKAFLNAFWMGDGSMNGKQKVIIQNPGDISDAVQLAIFYEGYRPSVSGAVGQRCQNIRYASPYISWNIQKTSAGKAPVWCPKTQTGTWVARQDGKIFITGNCYWLFDKPTTPALWQQIQWRLIEYFESDTGIADFSRVMRLPGFDHLKYGEDPYPVQMIECDSTRRYTLEDFDRVLPPVPEWRLKLERHSKPYEAIRTDEGNDWDIRNFKHVLNHYKERSRREWDTCQCPVHATGNGHSKDSLHINSHTGAYHCWHGCDGKDIYKAVCDLAGWKPEKRTSSSLKKSESANERPQTLKELNDRTVVVVSESDSDTTQPLKDLEERTDKYKRFRELVSVALQLPDPIERDFALDEIAIGYRKSRPFMQKVVDELEQRRKPDTEESDLVDVVDLLNQPREGKRYLIEDFVPLAESILLSGKAKSGKSLLAYEAAYAVASGSTFLGKRVKQGRVLIIQCEEGKTELTKRLDTRGFDTLPRGTVKTLRRFKIHKDTARLESIIAEFRPSLVIIDSLRKVSAGAGVDENKAEFANPVYELSDLIRGYGASTIFIHHDKKDKEAQGIDALAGTSALAGAVWGIFRLLRVSENENDPSRHLSMTVRGDSGSRHHIQLTEGEACSWSWKWVKELNADPEDRKWEEAILRVIHMNRVELPEMTMANIVECCGLEPGDRRLYRPMNRLIKRERLTCRKDEKNRSLFWYSLPSFSHSPQDTEEVCNPDESTVAHPDEEEPIEQLEDIHCQIHPDEETKTQEDKVESIEERESSNEQEFWQVVQPSVQLQKLDLSTVAHLSEEEGGSVNEASVTPWYEHNGVVCYTQKAKPKLPARNPSIAPDARQIEQRQERQVEATLSPRTGVDNNGAEFKFVDEDEEEF